MAKKKRRRLRFNFRPFEFHTSRLNKLPFLHSSIEHDSPFLHGRSLNSNPILTLPDDRVEEAAKMDKRYGGKKIKSITYRSRCRQKHDGDRPHEHRGPHVWWLFGSMFTRRRCVVGGGVWTVVLRCVRRRYLLAVIARGCIATVPYGVRATALSPETRNPRLNNTIENFLCMYFTQQNANEDIAKAERKMKLERRLTPRGSLLMVCSTLVLNTLGKMI